MDLCLHASRMTHFKAHETTAASHLFASFGISYRVNSGPRRLDCLSQARTSTGSFEPSCALTAFLARLGSPSGVLIPCSAPKSRCGGSNGPQNTEAIFPRTGIREAFRPAQRPNAGGGEFGGLHSSASGDLHY